MGRGITPENIEDAHTFITGACSCVVKEQNPGFDLLLDVDWAAVVGDVLVSDPPSSVGTKPKLLTIPPGARPELSGDAGPVVSVPGAGRAPTRWTCHRRRGASDR
ncbi:MAG: hypothetical protein EBS51_15080 [Planctomycetia bacterium]|nr:hypothetical protein [Planctomycetia bacterium]